MRKLGIDVDEIIGMVLLVGAGMAIGWPSSGGRATIEPPTSTPQPAPNISAPTATPTWPNYVQVCVKKDAGGQYMGRDICAGINDPSAVNIVRQAANVVDASHACAKSHGLNRPDC